MISTVPGGAGNPLIRRLSAARDLARDDLDCIAWLCADLRSFRSGDVLLRQGEHCDNVFAIATGWAQRYKMLSNGQRQVFGYLLPGDLSDVHAPTLHVADHSISLLTAADVAVIPRDRMLAAAERHPAVLQAFVGLMLVEKSILREWLLNIGRREAYERLAHLFYELYARMDLVGLVEDDAFSLPLTQSQIGEGTALTAVHVNRTLRRLRDEGIIELKRRRLRLLDPERLKRVAGFDGTYLHDGR